MALLKYSPYCSACDRRYLVLADPEERGEPIYCPFCGNEGASENDTTEQSNDEEEDV